MSDRSRFIAAMVLLLTTLLLVSAPVAWAKKPPVVQYVNISPLPGGGVALGPDGEPDGQGAMQINIPVAYTPGAGFANLGVYAGKYIKGQPNANNTNGSGVLGFGFGKRPRFYISAMAVSSIIFNDSKAVSAQLQVVEESERSPAIAIGAQDILDKESKDFSAVATTGVGYYGVATKQFTLSGKNVHATLGYGSGRFLSTVFGGISVPLSDQFSFAAEYDGFQFNTGVGWRPWGRHSKFTVLGAYNGEAGGLFGAQATGDDVSPLWAIPLALLLMRD